jgi:predicted ATPase
MTPVPPLPEEGAAPWNEERVKALLNFPRYPLRLIQEEPWQTWISRRGGLRAVYDFLRNYSFSPSHRRILEVVLSRPEEVSDVYADHLNISRATYFYRLRELLPAVVHALNTWQHDTGGAPPSDAPRASAPPTIPTPLTGLIGADAILTTLHTLLLRDDIRLLTLLGPGGVGKTRLSIELVTLMRGVFADQVAFVDLSPLRSVDEILPAIAQALGIGRAAETSLAAYLVEHRFLLVLDNFEHLLAGAPVVSDLLVTSPGLKVVVTSRAALRIYGEYEFIIPPLPAPTFDDDSQLETIAASPAVALFIERARAVNPAFTLTQANAEAVVELCLRMDGLPLAIELAAYQAKYYSPQAMLVRVSNARRLNFLNQGPKRKHPHQHTPRDILDWSYALLNPELQVLFSRLAVFAGGCTTDAAEAVIGDDVPVAVGLSALTEQSLLQQHIQSDGEPRYVMLGITREYGLEQLDQRGETARYERAHANYFLALAEAHYRPRDLVMEEMRRDGVPEKYVVGVPEPRFASRDLWLEAIAREHDNFDAAMQYYVANRSIESLGLIEALWDTWRNTVDKEANYHQAIRVLEQTADYLLPSRGLVLLRVGWMAYDLRDINTMQWAFQSAQEIAARLTNPYQDAIEHIGLAEVAQIQCRWEDADASINHAFRVLQMQGVHTEMAWALLGMGRIAMSQGEIDVAIERISESVALPGAESVRADALCALGQVQLYRAQLDTAALTLGEALYIMQGGDAQFRSSAAVAQILLGHIDAQQGQFDAAAANLSAGMALSKQQGYLACIEMAHSGMALLAIAQGDTAQARRSLRDALQIQESIKEGWRCLELLETVAGFMLSQREPLSAARLLGASENLRGVMGIARFPLHLEAHEQNIALLRDLLDAVTLDDAWLAGQSLALDQALIYALRCLE